MALEAKFDQNKADLKEVQDTMLTAKTAIAQQVHDVRAEMVKQTQRHQNLENRMD